MSFVYNEYQLPFTIITVIIGYQIAVYFLYQYYRYRKSEIGLNKILLAYGLFFLLAISGILIRMINNYFVEDPFLSTMLEKHTLYFLIFAIASFLVLISSKSFQAISKSKIPRILLSLMLIPIIHLVFIPEISPLFYMLMIIVLFGLMYIIFFQYKLIKLSKGKIKNRLWMIFFGELLLLGAVLIGGQGSRSITATDFEVFLILITEPIAYFGLLLIYLGEFRFPAFLEFNWKENLVQLTIINKKEMKELYSYNFEKSRKLTSQDEMKRIVFPKAIIGINDIISSVSKSASDSKLKIIKKGDLTILLDYGDDVNSFIIYALIVREEQNSLKHFLKTVKAQFEGFFKEILISINDLKEGKEIIFSSFNIVLDNIIGE